MTLSNEMERLIYSCFFVDLLDPSALWENLRKIHGINSILINSWRSFESLSSYVTCSMPLLLAVHIIHFHLTSFLATHSNLVSSETLRARFDLFNSSIYFKYNGNEGRKKRKKKTIFTNNLKRNKRISLIARRWSTL